MSKVKDQELNESTEQRAKDFELFLANRNPADADGGECERISESRERQSSEPIRLETDGVFDSAGYSLPQAGEFFDNPMAAMMQPLIQYFEAIKPKAFEPPKTEHKIRIYHFKEYDSASLEGTAEEIENLLNDGYCCHMPTVVGNFVIMDFSRRKESEENERKQ